MLTRTNRIALLVVGGAIVVALWRLGLFGLHDPTRLRAFSAQLQALPFSKLVFVVVYALASAVAVPASPLTLAGGALFGLWWGVLLNWSGAMLGAALAFGIARAFRARPTTSRGGRLASLAGRQPSWTLFRLRVIPVIPFALLNLSAAAADLSWASFLIATGLGIIPVIAVYTTFAASLMAGVEGSSGRAFGIALGTGAAIIAVSFGPRLLRRRGRHLPNSP